MKAQVDTMAELIELILSEFDISITELAKRSEFHRTHIHYLRKRETRIDIFPYETINRLACAIDRSAADLYQWAGIDVLATPNFRERLEFENLRLSPLVSVVEVNNDKRLQRAIRSAVLARRYYYFDGKFDDATAALHSALKDALAANALRLATYLKIYLAQLSEMTGDLKASNNLCREAAHYALEIQQDGRKLKNKDLEWLGTRLSAQVKVRELWANHWAYGVSEASIPAGEALVEELEDCNVPQEIPKVYYFFARCAVALERFDDALKYMRNAKTQVLALRSDLLTPFELFLDTGINAEGGQPMYSWKEDQILTETADIYVSAGQPEKAWTEYAKVKDHRRPRLYLSFFNWHNPRWQEMLEENIRPNDDDGYPFGYSTADWDATVWSSGYVRLQATRKFDEGQLHLEAGELDAAMQCFKKTKDLALGYEKKYMNGYVAEDLLLKNEIATSILTALRGDKLLAVSGLNMIKVRVERMNNPLIAAQYKAAFQRIAQL